MDAMTQKYSKIVKNVEKYYSQKIKKYGATHKGVDWNSFESQNIRFEQLLRVTGVDRNCSVIDYGCGYGAMASYMQTAGYRGTYTGFDITEAMIEEAKRQQFLHSKCFFVNNAASLHPADYTVASGIFNVKQTVTDKQWIFYIINTLQKIAELSKKGFSFNMLTIYSDKEKMRPYLFYADPCFFIDHCIRKYSRSVAMLQDYGLYEFTILVRRE